MTGTGNRRDPSGAEQEPSVSDALIPLGEVVVLIGGALLLFGLDALDGPIQVALVLCAMVAALVAMKNGHPWEEVQHAAQGSLASITSAISSLVALGTLIGVWTLVEPSRHPSTTASSCCRRAGITPRPP